MEARNQSGKNEENKSKFWGNLKGDLTFVVVIFLIRGLYYLAQFRSEYNPADQLKLIFTFTFFLLLAIFYFVAVIGILLKRRFGYYLSWFLIGLDLIFSLGYLLNPMLALIGVPLLIVLILAVKNSKKHFKKKDKIDTIVVWGMIILIILNVAALMYSLTLPKPESPYLSASKEAIEKNDVKICDKISGGERRRCITVFVQNKGEPEYCELIDWSDDKDSCYLYLAIQKNDSSLCSLIKRDYDRGMCYGSTKNQTTN